jgi:chromosome segregation ATPase
MPAIRKENQATMTDEGKYSYSHDPTSGALTMKEASLKRKAEDQEILLAEHRVTI